MKILTTLMFAALVWIVVHVLVETSWAIMSRLGQVEDPVAQTRSAFPDRQSASSGVCGLPWQRRCGRCHPLEQGALFAVGLGQRRWKLRENDLPPAAKLVSVGSTFKIKRFATLRQFAPRSQVQVGRRRSAPMSPASS